MHPIFAIGLPHGSEWIIVLFFVLVFGGGFVVLVSAALLFIIRELKLRREK